MRGGGGGGGLRVAGCGLRDIDGLVVSPRILGFDLRTLVAILSFWGFSLPIFGPFGPFHPFPTPNILPATVGG